MGKVFCGAMYAIQNSKNTRSENVNGEKQDTPS